MRIFCFTFQTYFPDFSGWGNCTLRLLLATALYMHTSEIHRHTHTHTQTHTHTHTQTHECTHKRTYAHPRKRVQLWSTGWNENVLSESAMRDRSDDPSHHEPRPRHPLTTCASNEQIFLDLAKPSQ